MKTIGIIGGMSPESTVLYYQIINRETNRRLGGNRSAKILLDSVDFEEIVRLQKSGDWAAAGNVLAQSARKLEAGGFFVDQSNRNLQIGCFEQGVHYRFFSLFTDATINFAANVFLHFFTHFGNVAVFNAQSFSEVCVNFRQSSFRNVV